MTRIPLAPLSLGLAGLIPFVWGAATYMSDALALWGVANLGPRAVGPYVIVPYGTVILSFMSGVLWGFATKANGAQAAACYALSVVPALWAFLMPGNGQFSALINLIVGFTGLLILDFAFSRWGLTPPWWMTLRCLLTGIVVTSLAVGLVV